MWQTILLGFVAVVTALQAPMESYAIEQQQQQRARETENMDPNLIHAMGEQIQRTIGRTLASHEDEFERRFEELENLCREGNSVQTDINLIPEDMDSKVQSMVENFVSELLKFSEKAVKEIEENMVAALDNAMADIDDKLQPVNEEITGLRNQMSMLVTQDEVADLQTKLSYLARNAATEIKTEVGNLPTKEDLHNHSRQLGDSLLEVTYKVDNLTSCGDSETVQQVLEKLMISDKDLGELSELLNDSSQNSQCNSNFETTVGYLESLKSITEVNKEALAGLGDSLENMQNTFDTRLEDLENVTQTLAESVQTPTEITTTTTSTTTPTPLSTTVPPPCLDSTFIGAGRSLDVCNAAVRFRKCRLDFVAFHCCRSCQDAGLLSSIPNFKASRTVPVLQALKSLRPG